MAEKPKAAMQAYKKSAVAAPNPEAIPDRRPSVSVLRMQTIATGPTGAATAKPISAPLSSSVKSIIRIPSSINSIITKHNKEHASK